MLIERTSDELPLNMQADLLDVSRSSLYYQPRAASAEEVRLKHRIDEIYTQLPYYGSRKIAAQLQREGMGIKRKTANVQISMDGKGRALDNIFTERLWRTVKYEEVSLHDYLSPREARQALTRYFTFYNQERLHQALDYQMLAEVYFQQASSKFIENTV